MMYRHKTQKQLTNQGSPRRLFGKRSVVFAIGISLLLTLITPLVSSFHQQRASALTLFTNGRYEWIDKATIYYLYSGVGTTGKQQFEFVDANPNDNNLTYTYK